MTLKCRNRLGVLVLAAILLATFSALDASAGIATSPLGIRGGTALSGLGSWPLGSHTQGNPQIPDPC